MMVAAAQRFSASHVTPLPDEGGVLESYPQNLIAPPLIRLRRPFRRVVRSRRR
jgi:hypothetical protein